MGILFAKFVFLMYNIARNDNAQSRTQGGGSCSDTFPAVVLLGARQVGKTTLAKKIASSRSSMLFDLEDQETRNFLRSNPVEKLYRHDGKLIVLDEVQKVPEIFEAIRVVIDRMDPNVPGKFLLLGSASGKMLNQSKENLFGRVGTLELFGFDCLETHADKDIVRLWDRGGFPNSYLAPTDEKSMGMRHEMCEQMFSSNNLAGTDARVSTDSLARLLARLARQQGGVANMQEIAGSLEIDRRTANQYIVMLTEMMLVRRLPAFAKVGGQSQVAKPKYYIRDSGILHSLCNMSVRSRGASLSNIRGASWEGFVIESIMAVLPPLWRASFYRSHNKYEIDLVLQKPGGGIWAVEIKSSPDAHGAGLSRNNLKAIDRLQPEKCFVVHGGETGQAMLANDVEVLSLTAIMNELMAQDSQSPVGSSSLPTAAKSSRLSALLAALEASQPNVPVLRDRFLNFCVQRSEEIFRRSRGANDADGRRDWAQVRGELVEWLVLECKMDVAAGSECSPSLARSVKKLLERILSLKFTPSIASDSITQADLCVCEMFVHFVAVLLDNAKFKGIRDLLDYGYVAAEKLRHYTEFYYPESSMMHNAYAWPEKLSAENVKDELYEHLQASEMKTARLVEAEQIIFCHGIKSKAGETIFPRILACVPDHALRPLEFFLRVQTDQGRVDFINCLKKEDGVSFFAEFGSKVDSRMHELLVNDKNRYRKWREVMAIDNWS